MRGSILRAWAPSPLAPTAPSLTLHINNATQHTHGPSPPHPALSGLLPQNRHKVTATRSLPTAHCQRKSTPLSHNRTGGGAP